jgi:ATP-dependent protease HslVU (ClpYQ) peptidase subunit
VTTVLADATIGVMVSDSLVTDGDRKWKARKVFRVKGELVAAAGNEPVWRAALEWLRGDGERPKWDEDSSLLVLAPAGLFLYDINGDRVPVDACEAIGTGGKAAICAYRALWTVGLRNEEAMQVAVRIVCGQDANSLGPVRVYRLR